MATSTLDDNSISVTMQRCHGIISSCPWLLRVRRIVPEGGKRNRKYCLPGSGGQDPLRPQPTNPGFVYPLDWFHVFCSVESTRENDIEGKLHSLRSFEISVGVTGAFPSATKSVDNRAFKFERIVDNTSTLSIGFASFWLD